MEKGFHAPIGAKSFPPGVMFVDEDYIFFSSGGWQFEHAEDHKPQVDKLVPGWKSFSIAHHRGGGYYEWVCGSVRIKQSEWTTSIKNGSAT